LSLDPLLQKTSNSGLAKGHISRSNRWMSQSPALFNLKSLLVFAAMILAVAPATASDKITVFAAASLKNALDDANAAWESQAGSTVVTSYAASSALATQIEAGAPADIFISADLDWMNYLQDKALIDATHAQELLGNKLVLVTSNLDAETIEISAKTDFSALLGNERLALAAVESVPAGKYAKAAFENFEQWELLKDKIASAENVRAALVLVSRGEAPYGVVYESDAKVDHSVKVIGTFPAGSHPAVIYPIGVIKGSENKAAQAYYDFLTSPAAASFFEKQGFTVLSKVGQ
jgi:molybdate transport system substrate-binding protein